MTILSQVVELLEEELDEFETVKAAWTSKPLTNFSSELPAALPYLAGIDSEPSQHMNETIQPCDYQVAVLIVCAVADLEERRGEVHAVMAGYQLDDTWEPFEHQSGSMIEITESIVWWRDIFAARNYQQ